MIARGFTLLEVLVALFVVAVALLALLTASGHYTRQSHELRERTLAHWVALDRIAAYRREPGFPDTGVSRGETMQAGVRWAWTVVVSEAPGESDLRRLDVQVARAARPDAPVVTFTGFIGRE